MGNKLQKPENWVRDLYDEWQQPLWGVDKVQKVEYPSFWGMPQPTPTNIDLQTLFLGKVFQFPVISPRLLDSGEYYTVLPTISTSELNAPSRRMMCVLSKMQAMRRLWEQSIEERNIYLIIDPFFELLNEYGNDIDEYLLTNLSSHLNYYGLIPFKDVKDQNSKVYFKDQMPHIPGTFRMGAILFLLISISNRIESSNAPFIAWKEGSAKYTSSDLPTLDEWNANIPLLLEQNGNFWTFNNSDMKSPEAVLEFWDKNREVILPIIHFHLDMKLGNIASPNKDKNRDTFKRRNDFLKILRFRNELGQPLFIFQFFNADTLGKYSDVGDVNQIISLYFFLLVKSIEKLIPNIWDTRQGVAERAIDFIKINPIDIGYLASKFDWYRTIWLDTAQWYFYSTNRPPWPPNVDAFGEDDMTKAIFEFMYNNPLAPLKVPPFSFSEWTRLTAGWLQVANKQWNDYFKWVVENVFAMKRPNWVNPGEQMKNPQGELLFYIDPKTREKMPLVNTYPDYGVMEEPGGIIGRGYLLLLPWVGAADWIWGSDFWNFVNNVVSKVFKLVIEALKMLYEVARAVLPALIIIAAVIGGIFLLKGGSNVYIDQNKEPT